MWKVQTSRAELAAQQVYGVQRTASVTDATQELLKQASAVHSYKPTD